MDQHQFLIQAIIFLTVAVIFVPIAKKLGLGSVLGYLLAGVVIGPFILGFVGAEGESILHFTEFGVVLMLFLIGLELQPELLWKLRKSILGLGLMQLIPDTAERFNVNNAYNATQNIRGGLAYLRWLLAYFEGDVKLAVAAYNAGEGAVNRYKGVPPYAETRQYVKRVMQLYPHPKHPFDGKITDPSPILKRG